MNNLIAKKTNTSFEVVPFQSDMNIILRPALGPSQCLTASSFPLLPPTSVSVAPLPVMTEYWMHYFKKNFDADRMRLIAKQANSLGDHIDRFELACKESGYNYINGRWMGTSGKRVYKRLIGYCTRIKKNQDMKALRKQQQEDGKTIANQRAVLSELRPLRNTFQDAQTNYKKVQQQRDRVTKRYVPETSP